MGSRSITASVGWKTTDARTTNNVTKSTIVQNNLAGSPATLTYPSGRSVTYGYSTAPRPTSATDQSTGTLYVSGASYAPQGSPSAVTFNYQSHCSGAGCITSYMYSQTAYNSRLQPTQMSGCAYSSFGGFAPIGAPAGAASGSCTPFFNLSYTFPDSGGHNNGNVQQITNNLDSSRTQNFTYDALNRMATAQTQTTGVPIPNSNCWGLTFGYDPWGNLLSSTVSGPSGCSEPLPFALYATKNNQLSTSSTQLTGYCYDSGGNMLDQATCPANPPHAYVYNAENQLVSAGGVNYVYDGDGKRVQKSNGTIYWYGMGTDPLDETDLTGSTSNAGFKEYVFFGGQRIASRDSSNNVSYYFSDHLGTSRVVTNSSGTILDDSDFYPFGGERPISSSSGNHYKFTSKERDSESGLDNFGARYNSSSMGRFMSPDAFYKDSHVGDPQSWNEYAYARNNPLRYVDPTGENATVSPSCSTDANNHKTCNVNVSATIAIYAAPGSNLTQDQLNQAAGTIQNSIQNAWTGSFQQDGVTYNVTTQVTVSVVGSQDEGISSRAQNVIGLTNGPADAARNTGAYVDPRGFVAAVTGKGPDTGLWDFNNLDNYAKHEFTHLLGVGNKDGAVLSNGDPAMRPDHATAQDFQWGIREATSVVNSWVNTQQYRPMRYGEVWEKPSTFSARTTVAAPWRWWK